MSFAPICVACAREMRCRKNDYMFADYESAAVWAGDMYQCEKCKARVVVGVAPEPVAEHYEPAFDNYLPQSQFELTRDKRP